MNNFIIISKTYSETTPESVKDGDFSDHGWVDERMELTFSELVDAMMEFTQPSESPDSMGTHVSYSTGFYTQSYATGTEREECMHFHRDNTPNAAKYWKWARIAADKKINKRHEK